MAFDGVSRAVEALAVHQNDLIAAKVHADVAAESLRALQLQQYNDAMNSSSDSSDSTVSAHTVMIKAPPDSGQNRKGTL